MEIKVKPKAIESTILATKEEDEKKMKECVVIGQETEEEISTKGPETMKILEGLRKNSDETKQDDSKNESRSSSASSSSSSSVEMMKKSENDKNSSQNEVNTKKEEEKKKENNTNLSNMMKHKKTTSHVWDCGSTLYDSFELNSFKRQLDSAISASARTMSMSHLPDRRIPETLPPPPPPPRQETSSSTSSGNKKHSNKISRSLQRFLKSVFRPKHHQSVSSSSTPSSPVYKAASHGGGDKDRYYVVYDKSGSLTTIPESTEKEVGPEMNSLVRKTVSERFPASRVVGISCA
ncbi:hypothetical protein AALP_AA6G315300 [Arabis alpina]|uniref:Avr9/Cf-9 rapidly elicited protein n=1 Tax=Arabis alpina TaxID=50452 RepID=A0A087GSZ0_ARAAL|nr:hypothetical protein AALP_AA6G315300 [Arabis alpina]